MAGPLDGIRVIDFSRVLAGPHCGRTLADLGADVIKVETPRPDVTRFSAPSTGRMSGYYAQQNAGKRNISLDYWAEGAREVALDLCRTTDVVVENFRPGTLRSFGLGYDDVAAINERVVYASITGYGQHGPWRGRMAYAPTVQAEAGLTDLSARHFGYPPAAWRTDSLSHGDVYAGLQAAIAILAALEERHRTGRGQHIDVSMAATLVRVNERLHVDATGDDLGAEPAVLGATDCQFFTAPSCARIVSSASLVGSLTFPRWLAAMRRSDLVDDARFRTAADRRAHFVELHQIVQAWILSFTDDAALDAQLDEAKVAIGRVRSLSDLRDTDWATYWGAFAEVTDSSGTVHTVGGAPWKFSAHSSSPPGAPAFQGEHNVPVLEELDYDAARIADLVERRAVVQRLPNTTRTS